MQKIEIRKDMMARAKDRAVLESADRERIAEYLRQQATMHNIDLVLGEWPLPMWRAMLDDARLSAPTRSTIALHVFGMRPSGINLESIYQTVAQSTVEFGTTFQMSVGRTPNCEILLNGRWYPVIVHVKFVEDEDKWTRGVQLGCTLTLGERSFDVNHYVARGDFVDESGEPRSQTVLQVLERFGYRALQTSPGEFNLRLVKAERAAAEFGQVVMVTGSVIAPSTYSWWRGFETQSLGTEEMPARCVVEPALEIGEGERGYFYTGRGHQSEELQSRLPFVRVFCLETKAYVYADVDDVRPYEFDTDSLSHLHLPADMHSILKRVFNTPIEEMFGDLLKGKHGGVVVLACGEPGVGKTLTAEIYAETTERPLYVLELGELGTKAADVEEKLQRVFARVTRWNAVLQFDECEIFLSKRGTDLERSAIVGIFLRLLDYYRGLLFLTTNRPDTLDDAVLSRVMLNLKYPHLDAGTREKIWQTMFAVAGLQLAGCTFTDLARLDLNGRQIRNLTRLAKILNPNQAVNRPAIQEVLRFGCGQELE